MQPPMPFAPLEHQTISCEWMKMSRAELACWEANGWSLVRKGHVYHFSRHVRREDL